MNKLKLLFNNAQICKLKKNEQLLTGFPRLPHILDRQKKIFAQSMYGLNNTQYNQIYILIENSCKKANPEDDKWITGL